MAMSDYDAYLANQETKMEEEMANDPNYGPPEIRENLCPACAGNGGDDEGECQTCYGTGQLECLNQDDDCSGPVELRMALSGTGKSFPRCDHHWSERLTEQEKINRDYPDSPIAPSWFNPADAGESWDDDY
jgi:hypothetical protein